MESNQTPVYKDQLKGLVSELGEVLPQGSFGCF